MAMGREAYSFEEIIAHGAFGTVWKCVHCATGATVAVKVIERDRFTTDGERIQLVREVEAMKRIEHPCIVRFYDLFHDDAALCIAMEFVPYGTLSAIMARQGALSAPACRRAFAQLVSAVEYLHSTARIVHRDIKADNIMCDESGNVKLLDFGLCNVLRSDADNFATPCGSPCFASPEALRGLSYTKTADVWALGVVLYAMSTGAVPFMSDNIGVLTRKITLSSPPWDAALPAPLIDVNRRLLEKVSGARITLAEVKVHPWFAQTEYRAVTAGPAAAGLDEGITDHVRAIGCDASTLRGDLEAGGCSPASVAYRVLGGRHCAPATLACDAAPGEIMPVRRRSFLEAHGGKRVPRPVSLMARRVATHRYPPRRMAVPAVTGRRIPAFCSAVAAAAADPPGRSQSAETGFAEMVEAVDDGSPAHSWLRLRTRLAIAPSSGVRSRNMWTKIQAPKKRTITAGP